ncbi:MAG TPA: shikimate dehydrogenase [Casimicrobiaceae bacterium]|nr:shikimate dehydrogenase [Casimicrobiaceae bacterium]
MADNYAVVGNPIAHSQSPQIHAAFAAQTGQDIVYDRLLAPLDAFDVTIEAFAAAGGLGLNVTMPFKQQAFALSHVIAPRAELAGAVNTLSRRDGHWHGDNTDGTGIVVDLTKNLSVPIVGRTLLILGAGGATRGILGPLLAEEPARVCIANRTRARAEEIVCLFSDAGSLSASAPQDLAEPFDIVINATPWDSADDARHLPDTIFEDGAIAYDLVYAEAPTRFMRWALGHGVSRATDGFGMLVEQAAESFAIWRGIRPQTAPVLASLRPGERTVSRTTVSRNG